MYCVSFGEGDWPLYAYSFKCFVRSSSSWFCGPAAHLISRKQFSLSLKRSKGWAWSALWEFTFTTKNATFQSVRHDSRECEQSNWRAGAKSGGIATESHADRLSIKRDDCQKRFVYKFLPCQECSAVNSSPHTSDVGQVECRRTVRRPIRQSDNSSQPSRTLSVRRWFSAVSPFSSERTAKGLHRERRRCLASGWSGTRQPRRRPFFLGAL